MKLLDRLLGRRPTTAALGSGPFNIDAMLERYGSITAVELENALALGTYRCANSVDFLIKAAEKNERHEIRFRIVCEFFYFFLHLSNRRFYADHGKEIGERWQSKLV